MGPLNELWEAKDKLSFPCTFTSVSTDGGVCMYLKDTIPYSVLKDFQDESNILEVPWVKLRPT